MINLEKDSCLIVRCSLEQILEVILHSLVAWFVEILKLLKVSRIQEYLQLVVVDPICSLACFCRRL